jgi:hypothetical protein
MNGLAEWFSGLTNALQSLGLAIFSAVMLFFAVPHQNLISWETAGKLLVVIGVTAYNWLTTYLTEKGWIKAVDLIQHQKES